jgi:hypothetical protein
MSTKFVQIATFNYPFPSENFKTELINSEIEFQEYQINESESVISVFSVKKDDIKRVTFIKEKIDIENSISELKHKNKLAIKLAYIAIIAILAHTIYQVYSFIRGQLW